MVVVIPDKKIRNVKLTGDEISLLIDELERVPFIAFPFFKNIVKKLKEAQKK